MTARSWHAGGVCVLVMLVVPGAASAAEPAYKAGVATRVITPEKPMWMSGYAARTKPADGKIHELYAKALCLQDAAGKRLVLVTTDLIVGFPGETEADFAETLRVVEASRFSSAFTFQYSIRPGTPAATMEHQVPKAVVQERYNRLIAGIALYDDLSDRAALEQHLAVVVAHHPGVGELAAQRLDLDAVSNGLKVAHRFPPAVSSIVFAMCSASPVFMALRKRVSGTLLVVDTLAPP